jgi:hypothetical protein
MVEQARSGHATCAETAHATHRSKRYRGEDKSEDDLRKEKTEALKDLDKAVESARAYKKAKDAREGDGPARRRHAVGIDDRARHGEGSR